MFRQSLNTLFLLLIPHARYHHNAGHTFVSRSISNTHGYLPHPAAFRRRRKRAPYKGNLGPRH